MNLVISAIIIALVAIITRKLIYDIIVLIKNRNELDLDVKLCPVCKSHKLKETKMKNTIKLKCNNCNYRGEMLEMNIKDADKIRKNQQTKNNKKQSNN